MIAPTRHIVGMFHLYEICSLGRSQTSLDIYMAVLGNKFSKVDYSRQKYLNIHKNKANLEAYSPSVNRLPKIFTIAENRLTNPSPTFTSNTSLCRLVKTL